MKVTLISHTPHAISLLLFTKATRLNMTPSLLAEMDRKNDGEKLAELNYMANTIPSSWEFIDYVFLVEGVSRAYTHQQVRTRQASYAQQTMRVLDMGEFEYVHTARNKEDPAAMAVIDECLEFIKASYVKLRALGQPPEDARGILPTNISTNIVCKFNLRTFVDLVRSRSGGRTQDEYQQVVRAMEEAVLQVHPWAALFLHGDEGRDYFAEIEAFARQEFRDDLTKKGQLLKIVDKMRKAR